MSHSKIMLPTNTGMICGRIANQQDLELGAAGGADRLDRLRVHVLDRLGDRLRDEADRAHRHRQHAGERAQADRRDEDQAPDDLVHRARHRHQEAADRVRALAERRDVGGAQPGHGNRQHQAGTAWRAWPSAPSRAPASTVLADQRSGRARGSAPTDVEQRGAERSGSSRCRGRRSPRCSRRPRSRSPRR